MEPKRYLRTLGGLWLHAGGPEGEVLLGPSKSLAVLAQVAMAPARERAAGRGAAAALGPLVPPLPAR